MVAPWTVQVWSLSEACTLVEHIFILIYLYICSQFYLKKRLCSQELARPCQPAPFSKISLLVTRVSLSVRRLGSRHAWLPLEQSFPPEILYKISFPKYTKSYPCYIYFLCVCDLVPLLYWQIRQCQAGCIKMRAILSCFFQVLLHQLLLFSCIFLSVVATRKCLSDLQLQEIQPMASAAVLWNSLLCLFWGYIFHGLFLAKCWVHQSKAEKCSDIRDIRHIHPWEKRDSSDRWHWV